MTGTLHEDRYTLLIISLQVLLRKRNVSDKSCRENRNTHFLFDNFFSENRAVYNIYIYIYIYTLRGFKTSDDAFRLSYSIAFDCSIRPFLDLFHSWLYIFHLSRFYGDGLVVSFLQVSSKSTWSSRLGVEALDQHSNTR